MATATAAKEYGLSAALAAAGFLFEGKFGLTLSEPSGAGAEGFVGPIEHLGREAGAKTVVQRRGLLRA